VIYLGRHTVGLGTRLAGTELTAVRYGRLLLLDGDRPIRARTLPQGPGAGHEHDHRVHRLGGVELGDGEEMQLDVVPADRRVGIRAYWNVAARSAGDAGGELGLATRGSIDPADQGRPAVRSSE
jgi:hypothetical protein